MINFNIFNRKTKDVQKGKIILHIGLHKTATTYFQNILEHNTEKLQEYSINYIDLMTVRKLVTEPIRKYNHEHIISKNLSPFMHGDRLILSDENIIGSLPAPVNNDFYSRAFVRLQRLLKVFKGFEVDVYITLRNYAEYMPSRYSEYLRHSPFLDYEDYYASIKHDREYWIELLEKLSSLKINKLFVSDFDNIIKNKEKYLESLIGQRIRDLSYNITLSQDVRRTKISHEVYEVLKFASNKLKATVSKDILRVIEQSYSTEKHPLDLIDTTLKAKLDSKYQDELQKIKSLPYISFLEF